MSVSIIVKRRRGGCAINPKIVQNFRTNILLKSFRRVSDYFREVSAYLRQVSAYFREVSAYFREVSAYFRLETSC